MDEAGVDNLDIESSVIGVSSTESPPSFSPIESGNTPPKERIEDPKVFFQKYEESDHYKSAYDKFFEGKKLASDVTEDEKMEAFEQSQNAKDSLLDFSQTVNFVYKPSLYDPEVEEAINEYIFWTRELNGYLNGGMTREQIVSLDDLRSRAHSKVAQLCKEHGVTKSERLGKAFGRLILISLNLDNYDSAKVPDAERLRRIIAA